MDAATAQLASEWARRGVLIDERAMEARLQHPFVFSSLAVSEARKLQEEGAGYDRRHLVHLLSDGVWQQEFQLTWPEVWTRETDADELLLRRHQPNVDAATHQVPAGDSLALWKRLCDYRHGLQAQIQYTLSFRSGNLVIGDPGADKLPFQYDPERMDGVRARETAIMKYKVDAAKGVLTYDVHTHSDATMADWTRLTLHYARHGAGSDPRVLYVDFYQTPYWYMENLESVVFLVHSFWNDAHAQREYVMEMQRHDAVSDERAATLYNWTTHVGGEVEDVYGEEAVVSKSEAAPLAFSLNANGRVVCVSSPTPGFYQLEVWRDFLTYPQRQHTLSIDAHMRRIFSSVYSTAATEYDWDEEAGDSFPLASQYAMENVRVDTNDWLAVVTFDLRLLDQFRATADEERHTLHGLLAYDFETRTEGEPTFYWGINTQRGGVQLGLDNAHAAITTAGTNTVRIYSLRDLPAQVRQGEPTHMTRAYDTEDDETITAIQVFSPLVLVQIANSTATNSLSIVNVDERTETLATYPPQRASDGGYVLSATLSCASDRYAIMGTRNGGVYYVDWTAVEK